MAIPITPITTHEADAKARLPGWLVDSTNYRAFFDVLTGPYQDIEDLLISILDGLSIETAVGVQLDVIGRILDFARTSLTEPDIEYRSRLFGRAAELALSGEPETLISVWAALWSPTNVFYDEPGVATVELTALLTVDPDDPLLDAAALAAIRAAKAGGVQIIPQIAVSNEFLFGASADADGSGQLPADANQGFGDEADADAGGQITPGAGNGGNLARVIT